MICHGPCLILLSFVLATFYYFLIFRISCITDPACLLIPFFTRFLIPFSENFYNIPNFARSFFCYCWLLFLYCYCACVALLTVLFFVFLLFFLSHTFLSYFLLSSFLCLISSCCLVYYSRSHCRFTFLLLLSFLPSFLLASYFAYLLSSSTDFFLLPSALSRFTTCVSRLAYSQFLSFNSSLVFLVFSISSTFTDIYTFHLSFYLLFHFLFSSYLISLVFLLLSFIIFVYYLSFVVGFYPSIFLRALFLYLFSAYPFLVPCPTYLYLCSLFFPHSYIFFLSQISSCSSLFSYFFIPSYFFRLFSFSLSSLCLHFLLNVSVHLLSLSFCLLFHFLLIPVFLLPYFILLLITPFFFPVYCILLLPSQLFPLSSFPVALVSCTLTFLIFLFDFSLRLPSSCLHSSLTSHFLFIFFFAIILISLLFSFYSLDFPFIPSYSPFHFHFPSSALFLFGSSLPFPFLALFTILFTALSSDFRICPFMLSLLLLADVLNASRLFSIILTVSHSSSLLLFILFLDSTLSFFVAFSDLCCQLLSSSVSPFLLLFLVLPREFAIYSFPFIVLPVFNFIASFHPLVSFFTSYFQLPPCSPSFLVATSLLFFSLPASSVASSLVLLYLYPSLLPVNIIVFPLRFHLLSFSFFIFRLLPFRSLILLRYLHIFNITLSVYSLLAQLCPFTFLFLLPVSPSLFSFTSLSLLSFVLLQYFFGSLLFPS